MKHVSLPKKNRGRTSMFYIKRTVSEICILVVREYVSPLLVPCLHFFFQVISFQVFIRKHIFRITARHLPLTVLFFLHSSICKVKAGAIYNHIIPWFYLANKLVYKLLNWNGIESIHTFICHKYSRAKFLQKIVFCACKGWWTILIRE